MATRDEIKSEILSKIDEVFTEDRELDQDGDVPVLAQVLCCSDEDAQDLIDAVDAGEAEEATEGE